MGRSLVKRKPWTLNPRGCRQVLTGKTHADDSTRQDQDEEPSLRISGCLLETDEN